MRTYTIIKTTALILALITAAITTAAAISCDCGDICVNETGWWRDGGAFNASTTPIQAAVNATASGDTICAQAGSYTENVDVTTSHLTLEGASADVVIVTAASSTDHVFEVTAADYVNISGFTATGTTGGNAGIYLGSGVDCCNIYMNNASMNGNGIIIDSSSNNTLADNDVSYNWLGGTGIDLRSSSNNTLLNNTANSNGFGIYLSSSSNNTLLNNTANSNSCSICLSSSSNNTLLNNTALHNSFGIGMWSSSNNTLLNNIANSNNRGIYLSSSSNNTLMDNTALGNDNSGIGLWSSSSSNMLTGNTASGNDGGICLGSSSNNTLTGNTASDNWYGLDLISSSSNTLTGNTASDNWYGICLSSSSSNTLTGNTVSDNWYYGIDMRSSSSNTLTGNTASDNWYGIYMWSSSSNNITCNWVHNNAYAGFYLVSGSTDNNISYNNIIANGGYNATSGGWEWQFYNSQTNPNPVEAKHNYWGAGMNNDTIDASIYDDEEGNGKVEFYPYETGPVPCAPIPELPTATLFAVGLLMLAGYARIGRKM